MVLVECVDVDVRVELGVILGERRDLVGVEWERVVSDHSEGTEFTVGHDESPRGSPAIAKEKVRQMGRSCALGANVSDTSGKFSPEVGEFRSELVSLVRFRSELTAEYTKRSIV